ncbi:TadA family conjugal transfer-associated ATPase [Microbacterium sp.]|uniref:TadA family conjugal transfer-associated ATPase n=1 Tax=Microbacterium sp. TaxID=51671 RepID=UPI0028A6E090|nr:TadA family conjugal transfer-associated ATPase [Microbacterium sp.]
MTRPPTDVVERVRQRLATLGVEPTPHSVAEALRVEDQLWGTTTVLTIVDLLRGEALGAGVLQPLLDGPGVTDVLVNGADGVFIDAGDGLVRTDVSMPDEPAVRRLAQRLAASAGRRLDDASPWVDGRLADGTRLHAVLSPIARTGTAISLRVPPRRALPLGELERRGAVAPPMGVALRELVTSRRSFLVTGGTGSGKTTVLAALLEHVPAEERLVIVEDSDELRPDHPHAVGLVARPANVEGAGAVELRDLVRQALRMRPDRIVVGEVRGAEVVDLLAALNTGHEGGCGTVHANAPDDVPARLEALGIAAGLSRAAVHAQAAAALDALVHVVRHPDGHREIAELADLSSDPSGRLVVRPRLTVRRGRVVES